MSAKLYDEITNKIVAMLETGVKPWQKPWQNNGVTSRPLRSTGDAYQGVNTITLWMASAVNGYSSPYWFGFNTAKKLGASVRKGEKAEHIVFYNRFVKKDTDASGNVTEKVIPLLKSFAVFNGDQIDNLPEQYFRSNKESINSDIRSSELDKFFADTGMDLRHGGNSAFYNPNSDHIQMPEFEHFKNAESYYGTLAHEAVHWTKDKNRLDRDFGAKRWGDSGYAMEELVAELGSAFLSADMGISPVVRDDHADYLASWLKVLKSDNRAIFTASSYASKAVDFLSGKQAQSESED